MELFGSVLISGLTVGLLYGLLAFSIVVLFKSTGVANFAQGNIATFVTFIVYMLYAREHIHLWLALLAGALLSAGVGLVLYLSVIRINDGAGGLSLTTRTLALYLLLFAVMNLLWATGQPFAFPKVVGSGGVQILGLQVPASSIVVLGVSLVLATTFFVFYNYSRSGLLLLGMAERPEVARLLGVDTRRMTALAWSVSAIVALIVGVLIAPTALLSSDMMEGFLLYAFTGAILGGLTSLVGAFVGGLAVGILSSLASVYSGPDIAVLAVFALLIAVLLVKPDGLLSVRYIQRL